MSKRTNASARIFGAILLAGVALLPPGESPAMCLDNRHPAARDEYHASSAVVIGKVLNHRELIKDPDDPQGVTATVYRVQVVRKLRGSVKRIIEVRSENTSSRFPMEDKEQYLLFLTQDKTAYYVDSCGNSGRADAAEKVLSGVRSED